MLDRIARAIESQKPDHGGGARAWWRWPLLVMLVIGGGFIAGWLGWRNSRELAKLRHDRFKTNQLAIKAQLDAQISANSAESAEAMIVANKQSKKVAKLDLQIHEARKRYEMDRRHAERITWVDLPRGD